MNHRQRVCHRVTCPLYTRNQSTSFSNVASRIDHMPDEHPTTSGVQPSSSSLLQRISDPKQFRRALRNIVEIAESLLTTVMSSSKMLPRSASAEKSGENVKNHRHQAAISAEPIVITVPLVLHLNPTVNSGWMVSETFEENVVNVANEPLEPIRTAAVMESPFKKDFYGVPMKEIEDATGEYFEEGPTEDDRYGDHTNLSLKPKNKASPRQQPPGLRDLHQTKEDKGDNKPDEQTNTTEQYYTPRGQPPICECEQSTAAHCSGWAAANDGSKANYVEQIFITKKLGEKGDMSVEEEEIRFNPTTENITVTRNYITVSGCNNHQQLERTVGFVNVGPISGTSAESSSLIGSSNKMQKSHQPQPSDTICSLEEQHESSSRVDKWFTPKQSLEDLCCCAATNPARLETTSKDTTADKLIPLLQNIFEVLQSMRDQQLKGSSNPSETHEPPKQPQIQPQRSFTDVPPTPPSSLASYAPYELPESTVLHDDTNHNMEVFEPPVRDIDEESIRKRPKKKLIPVDMELLRSDGNFGWEPEPLISVETQVNAASLMNMNLPLEGSFIFIEKTPRLDEINISMSRETQVDRSSPTGTDHAQEPLAKSASNSPSEKSKQVSIKDSEAEQKDDFEMAETEPKDAPENAETEEKDANENLDQSSQSGSKKDLSGQPSHPPISDAPRCCGKAEKNPFEDSCECICTDPSKCAEDCCGRLRMKKSGQSGKGEPVCHKLPEVASKAVQVEGESPETKSSATKIPDSSLPQQDSANLPTDISAKLNPSQEGITQSQIEPTDTKEVLVDIKDLQAASSAKVPPLENLEAAAAPACDGAPSPVTKADVGTLTDRTEFDDQKPGGGPCGDQGSPQPLDPDTCKFIDSLVCDLEEMKSIRENACKKQRLVPLPTNNPGEWQKPPAELSYPVTIEKVKELGPNALFVKWIVHNKLNIAGYELFLDGFLTNQYYNAVHRAAVICEVNLQCPHRIILRAKPQALPKPPPALCNTSDAPPAEKPICKPTNPEEVYRQPDGSVWYPSVYHFEPSFYSAPAKDQFEVGNAMLLNASQE